MGNSSENKKALGLTPGSAKRKPLYRCIEKVTLEAEAHKKDDISRLWDIARNSIVADSMAEVVLALQRLIILHHAGAIRIVRFKDRFREPTEGGWADLSINCIFPHYGPKVVWELQIVHKS